MENAPQGLGAATGNAPTASLDQIKETPASPEQQEMFDALVGMSMVALYDQKFSKSARNLLGSEPNPVMGVAKISVSLITKAIKGAKSKGANLDLAVILHGGYRIVSEVVEFAVKSAKIDMNEEDAETAFLMAADMVRPALEGMNALSPEEIQKIDAELEKLKAMAPEGAMDGVQQRLQGVDQGLQPKPAQTEETAQ